MSLRAKLAAKLGVRRPPLNPDTGAIRALAALLAETGLTEIEYAVGDERIRVAREVPGKAVAAATGAPVPAATPAPLAVEPPTVASARANGSATTNGAAHAAGVVPSPMVGIAYLAPEPGGAPFVQVGDTVGKGQTLLIIEAMKVMNQIRAPQAGRVGCIFIADSEPVEYGAPLMLLE